MKQTGRKRQISSVWPGPAWSALFLFLLCGTLLPGQVSVSAELSQDEILIGDQPRLTILSFYQDPAEITDVGFAVLEETAGLEILRAERFEKDNGQQGKLLEVQLTLTVFDSGFYRIPPIPVAYRQNGLPDTAWTAELNLKANTMPITVDSVQLMPIKDIIGEPMNVWDALPWMLGLFLLIALGLLAFFLARRQPPPLPPPPPLRVPAHQLALEQLDQLEARRLWQQGLMKDYHSSLAHIIREYLQHRFQLAALESTTDEILLQLAQAAMLPGQQDSLQRLLQSADLVKFAKAAPPASYHTEAIEEARSFILQTGDEEAAVEIPREIPGMKAEEAGRKSAAPPPYILDAGGWPILLAGFWRRFWARLLDVCIFPFLVLLAAWLALGRPENTLAFGLFYLVGLGLYHVLMEHYFQGTLGKLLLGIHVADEKGAAPSLGQAALRFVGKLISESALGLGYLFYFLNRNRRQALHDMMARTYVIRKLAQKQE